MSPARPPRRMIWLALGTVAVPMLVVALYGVLGIRNGEAYIAEQHRRLRETHLRQVSAVLAQHLGDVEEAVRVDAFARCPDGLTADCPLRAEVAALWVWRPPDGPPSELVGRIPLEVPQGGTHWFADATGQLPIAVYREDEHTVAWRLDPERLEVRLREVSELPVALTPAETSPPGALPLAPPMSGWRIGLGETSIEAPRDRPRARWHYAGVAGLLAVFVVGLVLLLRAAYVEARRAAAQSQWVSSLGHEIRTPLTSIQLFAETLRSGRLRDPKLVDEALATLARESERLSRRAEQVLHWARAEAGRPFYRVAPRAPFELAGRAVEALRAQAPDAEVEIEVDHDLPEISVDADAVVEALLNLLQNAWKFTRPPRPIRLSAVERGRWLGLVVADEGPGIAAVHHKRIFDRFYRVAPDVEGTGLGLAIVKAVVRGHRGKVDVDSEEGRGTTITLWFRT